MQVIAESEVLRFYRERESAAMREEWVINGKAMTIDFEIDFDADSCYIVEANMAPRDVDDANRTIHKLVYDRSSDEIFMEFTELKSSDEILMEFTELKSERLAICNSEWESLRAALGGDIRKLLICKWVSQKDECPKWESLGAALGGDIRKMPEWTALQKKLRDFKVMKVMKTEELEALRESVLGQRTKKLREKWVINNHPVTIDAEMNGHIRYEILHHQHQQVTLKVKMEISPPIGEEFHLGCCLEKHFIFGYLKSSCGREGIWLEDPNPVPSQRICPYNDHFNFYETCQDCKDNIEDIEDFCRSCLEHEPGIPSAAEWNRLEAALKGDVRTMPEWEVFRAKLSGFADEIFEVAAEDVAVAEVA